MTVGDEQMSMTAVQGAKKPPFLPREPAEQIGAFRPFLFLLRAMNLLWLRAKQSESNRSHMHKKESIPFSFYFSFVAILRSSASLLINAKIFTRDENFLRAFFLH